MKTSAESRATTLTIYNGLIRLVKMEIEAEWAEYLKRFREEQDRGNGQIAAAWPNEEACLATTHAPERAD